MARGYKLELNYITIAMFRKSFAQDQFGHHWMDSGNGHLSPEKLLLLAMLDRSVRDVTERYCKEADSRDAAHWFMGTSGEVTGFSFPEVCEFLDLDEQLTRAVVEPKLADLLCY